MKRNRFNQLTSAGPIFPAGYKATGWELSGVKLSPLAEEMLWKAAQFLDSDYEKEAFAVTSNMWICLQPELPKGMVASWPTCQEILREMKAEQENLKAAKKALSKEEKLAEKAVKDALKEIHGFAMLDGERVRLANCNIEEPNWILTRSKDPRKFCWKYVVEAKDVTLNIVNDQPPVDWNGQIKSDPTAMWVMKYSINCGLPTMRCFKKLNKVIAFHGEVSVRQEAIEGKFDVAENILSEWSRIQKEVLDAARKGRHDAIIVYLIQETGIRIGGGRDATKMAFQY